MRLEYEKYPFPIKSGHTPFLHQIKTTEFLLWNKRSYVFNEMGTGKTLSALWAADFLIINEKIRRVLIVCPLSTMRAAWGRDILFNLPHRKFAIAHGPKDIRAKIIRGTAELVIINHDGLKIVEDHITNAGFDLMIVDELTAFKNYSTDRTKVACRIANRMKAVWGLTGAPTPNGPVEAYGQAKVVNPTNPFLPRFFTQFRDRVLERVNAFVWIPKHDANQLVHKILQPAIRYTRDECLDLPPCTKEVRLIEMTQEQKVAYETMRQRLLIEHKDGTITAANAAIKLLKLMQIAAGAVKDDDGNVITYNASSRMSELYDILEATPQRKLVIFAAFRAVVENINEFFLSKKVKSAIIYGSVDHKERARHIEAFQDGDLEVLVIQPQAAAHGITLTAASTVVWQSMVPSNEIYGQANDRIARIGQSRNQLIIHLIGCQAENHMLRLLERKQANSTDLLNSFSDFLSNDPIDIADLEPSS
jgi:SNF2 family DNA or RNA helicase